MQLKRLNDLEKVTIPGINHIIHAVASSAMDLYSMG
jgi:hypothetical protein